MKKSLRQCNDCNKFYDYQHINFSFNLALSKSINDETDEEMKKQLLNMNKTLSDKDKMEWCTCYNEEKANYLGEAEDFLVKTQVLNEKIEEDALGFDFKINKSIIYHQNQKTFNDTLFLKFLKSLKTKLKDERLLSFSYIGYDNFIDKKFEANEYYSNPNFLLIQEFENLSQDNASILIKLNNIIKQRESNNKKTFILTSKKSEAELKKFMLTRFYPSDEHIVFEFIKLINQNFETMNITTIEEMDNVKINTLNPTRKKRTSATKKKEPVGKKNDDTTTQIKDGEELEY